MLVMEPQSSRPRHKIKSQAQANMYYAHDSGLDPVESAGKRKERKFSEREESRSQSAASFERKFATSESNPSASVTSVAASISTSSSSSSNSGKSSAFGGFKAFGFRRSLAPSSSKQSKHQSKRVNSLKSASSPTGNPAMSATTSEPLPRPSSSGADSYVSDSEINAFSMPVDQEAEQNPFPAISPLEQSPRPMSQIQTSSAQLSSDFYSVDTLCQPSNLLHCDSEYYDMPLGFGLSMMRSYGRLDIAALPRSYMPYEDFGDYLSDSDLQDDTFSAAQNDASHNDQEECKNDSCVPQEPESFTPPRWSAAYYEDEYDGDSVLDMFPDNAYDENELGTLRIDGGFNDSHNGLTISRSSSMDSAAGPPTPTTAYYSSQSHINSGRRSLPTVIDTDDAEVGRFLSPYLPIPQINSLQNSTCIPAGITNTPHLPILSTKPKFPFQMAVSQMENAELRDMVKHLSQDSVDSASDEAELQELEFNQNVWALMARQWLTQGKQLQCPAHEMLVSAKPADGRRILNVHRSAADGWVLAAKYPNVNVFTLSTSLTDTVNIKSWPTPPNLHTVFAPPTVGHDIIFPFPNDHFDVIISRDFSTTVKSASWLSTLRECHRILSPGGWLEIQSLTPTSLISGGGKLLNAWVESQILLAMHEDGLVVQSPSERIQEHIGTAGFTDIKTARIALPATETGDQDAGRLMVLAGRHYYAQLYGEFLKAATERRGEGEDLLTKVELPWWWKNGSIRQECENERAMFGFVISFGRKALSF